MYLADVIDPESFSSAKAELDDILADKAVSKPMLVLVPKPDASGIANECRNWIWERQLQRYVTALSG